MWVNRYWFSNGNRAENIYMHSWNLAPTSSITPDVNWFLGFLAVLHGVHAPFCLSVLFCYTFRWEKTDCMAHAESIIYSIFTWCCFIFVDYHKVFSRLILCSSINFMVASLEHRQSADTRPQQNTTKRDAWVSFVGYIGALASEAGIAGMDK